MRTSTETVIYLLFLRYLGIAIVLDIHTPKGIYFIILVIFSKMKGCEMRDYEV
jgi:hypothetical protein